MLIRFHQGVYVDAVIPTAVAGATMGGNPNDVVWSMSADINPSKAITETANVQATDPQTGQPMVDATGMPIWETTTVTDPITNETSKQIVTQQVQNTYSLMQRPNIFTPADIASVVLSYKVVTPQ